MDNGISTNQPTAGKTADAPSRALTVRPSRQAAPDAQAASPAPPVERAEPGAEMRDLAERLSEQLSEFARDRARELEFQIGEESGDVVILVREAETGEIVRTIPPDEASKLLANLDAGRGAGALLSEMA
jgi:flagellar protein FlaG